MRQLSLAFILLLAAAVGEHEIGHRMKPACSKFLWMPKLLDRLLDRLRSCEGTRQSADRETSIQGWQSLPRDVVKCLSSMDAWYPATSAEASHLHWNQRLRATPAVVVNASSASDVSRAVRCARAAGLTVSARGGGHSDLALAVKDGAMVVNLQGLDDFRFDDGTMEVWLGPGLRLGQVYSRLHARGRYLPAGFESGPSVGGHVLGGGRGPLGHRHGLLIDHLLEVEMVDADGRILRANATQHKDLFWVLRGAGHNQFGIITGLRFKTVPARNVTRFQVKYKVDHLLDLWNVVDRASSLGNDYVALVWERTTDNPKKWWIGLKGQMGDKIEDISDLTKKLGLESIRLPRYYSLQYISYLEATKIWSGLDEVTKLESVDQRSRFHWIYSAGFSTNFTDTMVLGFRKALETPGPNGLRWEWEVTNFGGAVADVAPTDTAFPHRKSRFYSKLKTFWYNSTQGEAMSRWHAAVSRDLEASRADGYYANHVSSEPPPRKTFAEAYYGVNVARLSHVKALYDPMGVFSYSQSIPVQFFDTPSTSTLGPFHLVLILIVWVCAMLLWGVLCCWRFFWHAKERRGAMKMA